MQMPMPSNASTPQTQISVQNTRHKYSYLRLTRLSKARSGEGLILREDQLEYMRAKKLADGKKERKNRKMVKGLMARAEKVELLQQLE